MSALTDDLADFMAARFPGERAVTRQELKEALVEWIERQFPIVIDVRTDPDGSLTIVVPNWFHFLDKQCGELVP